MNSIMLRSSCKSCSIVPMANQSHTIRTVLIQRQCNMTESLLVVVAGNRAPNNAIIILQTSVIADGRPPIKVTGEVTQKRQHHKKRR